MNNKIEKNLTFTCSTCFSLYQLLETYEKESANCEANCQSQWQALLSKHYQDHIILHLAHQESQKEEHD